MLLSSTVKPELLKNDLNQYIAFEDGQILDHDWDDRAMAERVYHKYGYRDILKTKTTILKQQDSTHKAIIMAKSASTYRGHSIERVGHGKKILFQTTINEKEWSSTTEKLVKAGIDTWIDQGVEPEEA